MIRLIINQYEFLVGHSAEFLEGWSSPLRI